MKAQFLIAHTKIIQACDQMSEIGGQMVLANAFGLTQFAAVAKVSEHP
jgi:hypothetical protein